MDSLDDLDGEGPLWQQIRRALAKNIASGIWLPGAKIPKETDLIIRYNAARMTVHRAIRSLASEGLVQRKRKFGTVVAVRPPDRPVFEIWDIAGEVARGDSRRAGLGVAYDVPLLWLLSVHAANGEPLQLEERIINLAAAPEAAEEDFHETPPGSWLLNHVAWTEAEHTILALDAPRLVAQRLDMMAGSACLVVERRTWNGDAPITFVRLWHDGARRRLSGRFQPLTHG